MGSGFLFYFFFSVNGFYSDDNNLNSVVTRTDPVKLNDKDDESMNM